MYNRSTRYVVSLVSVLLCLSISVAQAGDVEERPDGTTIWRAGIDGVEIEWAPDGRWNRIYSQYAHPVAFPDRQGIAKAYIIAEEKAKVNILRFMEQQVQSGRIITEVQNDFSESRMSQRGAAPGVVSKDKSRQIIENLSEITSSQTVGRLAGVIILERGYDEPREEVWVKVGLSRKTIGAAGSVRESLTGDGVPRSSHRRNVDEFDRGPGSERQRIRNDDW